MLHTRKKNFEMEKILELEIKLAKTRDPHQRNDLMNALANELRHYDPERALALAKDSQELARSEYYLEGTAESLICQGTIHETMGQYGEAIIIVNEAFALLQEADHPKLKVRALCKLSDLYVNLADYATSLEFGLQALELAKKINNPSTIAKVYNSINVSYVRQGKYEPARKYLEQALAIMPKENDNEQRAQLESNLSGLLCWLGEFPAAIEAAQRALELVPDGYDSYQAQMHGNLGYAHLHIGDLDTGMDHMNHSLDLARKCQDSLAEITTTLDLSDYLIQQDALDQALPHVQQALRLSEMIESPDQQYTCHEQLAQIYKQRGELENALNHFEHHHRIKDDIHSRENDRRVQNLQILHDTRHAQEKAAILKKQNQELAGKHTQLEASEKRYRTIFEQAAVGVAEVDSISGDYIRINQRYCDIVGYTPTELLTLDFKQITHPADVKIDIDNMTKLKAGNFREFFTEKRYIRKDGSPVWVRLAVSSMWSRDEKPSHHISIVSDISQRKQAEASLQKRTEELQTMVNLMAGREIRMAELKGVIRQLRSQLEAEGFEPVANDPLLEGLDQ